MAITGSGILAASIALLLAGCATGERMGSLVEGMSPAEVTSVLGEPTGQQRAGNVVRYEYADRMVSGWSYNRADFYAIFEDDKLAQRGTAEVRQGQHTTGTIMVLPPIQ